MQLNTGFAAGCKIFAPAQAQVTQPALPGCVNQSPILCLLVKFSMAGVGLKPCFS